jgi:phage shock protein C
MKRLYRSRKDKMIAGVCGGIGEYFNIDPVIIRVIAIVLTLWGGSGIIAYIIAMIIIPLSPEPADDKIKRPSKAETSPPKPATSRPSSDTGSLIVGIILVILGAFFLMRNFTFFNEYYWWFRHQIGHIFWPAVLIIIGAFIIIKGTRK